MNPVATNETLCRDVYPAEVLFPGDVLVTDVRVFVTTHRLLVFRVGADRRCEVAYDLPLTVPGAVPASMDTMRQGRLECPIADGTAWVNLGRGCGCGSPLKALGSPIGWTSR